MLHRSWGCFSNLGRCVSTCCIMILTALCRLKPVTANVVITRTRPMGLNCMPQASISCETNSRSTGLHRRCMARPKSTRAIPWLEYCWKLHWMCLSAASRKLSGGLCSSLANDQQMIATDWLSNSASRGAHSSAIAVSRSLGQIESRAHAQVMFDRACTRPCHFFEPLLHVHTQCTHAKPLGTGVDLRQKTQK